MKIMTDDKNFRKQGKSRKKTAGHEKYSEQLDRTCVLWPKDAFQQMKKTEDKLFLESMIADRKAFLGKTDVKSVKHKTTRITLEKSILDEFYQNACAKNCFLLRALLLEPLTISFTHKS